MRIAIHHRSGSFSDYWIRWCDEHGVPYKCVDAYASDFMEQVRDCGGFMWHWHHNRHADQLIARQIAMALETAGKRVFPNVKTAWHFDDKIGQKYLLEAMDLPLVPTYCFYQEAEALAWVRSALYPLVFKLRSGSGSSNVKLVRHRRDASRLVRRAFKSGFRPVSLFAAAKQKLWECRRDRNPAALARMVYLLAAAAIGAKTKASRHRTAEVGYAYFQEFVPGNEFDDRLVVIGNRCFGVRRHCRTGDFRASGSGVKTYDHRIFPESAVRLAFEVAQRLGTQCVAIDLIYKSEMPVITEISYGFITGSFYEDCDGYFDDRLVWHHEEVKPQVFMIEDFVRELAERTSPQTSLAVAAENLR